MVSPVNDVWLLKIRQENTVYYTYLVKAQAKTSLRGTLNYNSLYQIFAE